MQINIEKVELIIKHAAANIVLPKFKRLHDNEIETKHDATDFVTVADKEVEQFITDEINSLYPSCLVVGEESVFKNPRVLLNLNRDEGVFIIDPIDGTGNYAKGEDNFGIMLAYAISGEIKISWIYLPVYEKMLIGEINSGAYINQVKQKITKKNRTTSEMIGAGKDLLPNVKEMKWDKCSATTYCDFIENKIDFIAHINRKMHSWDHMPGLLLAKEAGGVIGTAKEDFYNYRQENNSIIVADSVKNFKEIQRLANIFLKETT